MTDAPKPPKRRRRKFTVAFVVLVSIVSWWYWPRGDARFVGKWAAVGLDKGMPVGEFNLSANGTASFTWYGSWHLTSWRVEDDALVFGPPEPLRPLVNQIESALGLGLPGQFSTSFAILDSENEKVHLFPGLLPCEPIELTRIPE